MREKRDAEFSGKNIEEAISKGLSELDLERDEVDVHIITPGNRGVLGIGAEDARVSLTYFVEAPEPVSEKDADTKKESKAATETRKARVVTEEADKDEQTEALSDEDFAEAEQLAIEVVGQLLSGMGIIAGVESLPPQGLMAEEAGEGRAVILDIEGEDLGILIGRRGESLMALQYLTRLIVGHKLKTWLNIILDVEQYRVRRERSLRQLALRMAERVASTHQPVPLEAMTPYDRRVVHLALQGHEAVTTKSIGEGDNRKVVIIPLKSAAQ